MFFLSWLSFLHREHVIGLFWLILAILLRIYALFCVLLQGQIMPWCPKLTNINILVKISCARARGAPAKSLDSDENFKPEHRLFCRKLRFVAIYVHFGDLWAKNVPFWFKNSVSWARSALLHVIYCIFC